MSSREPPLLPLLLLPPPPPVREKKSLALVRCSRNRWSTSHVNDVRAVRLTRRRAVGPWWGPYIDKRACSNLKKLDPVETMENQELHMFLATNNAILNNLTTALKV